MFNDFKILVYDKVITKIRILFNIYRRLDLSDFENRYNQLLSRYNNLYDMVENLPGREEEVTPEPPPIPEPEPEPPTLLPDLTITDILATVQGENSTEISMNIRNIGTAISPPSSVEINIPVTDTFTIPINVLNIGQSQQVSIIKYYDSLGEFTTKEVRAEVNKIPRTVTESNYNNNIATVLGQFRPSTGNIPAYFRIHTHTPEGFEIGSLINSNNLYNSGSSYGELQSARIYINNKYITNSAYTLSQHNQVYNLSIYNLAPGTYPCRAEWNGMIINLGNITFLPNIITDLIFDFPRYIVNLPSFNYNIFNSFSIEMPPSESIQEILFNRETDVIDEVGRLFGRHNATYFIYYGNWSINLSLSTYNHIINSQRMVGAFPPVGGYLSIDASFYNKTSLRPFSINLINDNRCKYWCQEQSGGLRYPGIKIFDSTVETSMQAVPLVRAVESFSQNPTNSWISANKNYDLGMINNFVPTGRVQVDDFISNVNRSSAPFTHYNLSSTPSNHFGTGF